MKYGTVSLFIGRVEKGTGGEENILLVAAFTIIKRVILKLYTVTTLTNIEGGG